MFLYHLLTSSYYFLFQKGSSQYRANCPHENVTCLSAVGVVFTIIFTYTGFILLFIGTMWNANIVAKLKQIRKQWRLLRQQKS